MRRKLVAQVRCARVVLLALMVARTVDAQEWSLGVRGGPSIPRLSGGGNEVSGGYSSILAPNFGLAVERSFSGRFSILAEVDYSGQGGQRKGLQPVTQDLPLPPPQGSYYYADFTNRSELDYLEVPILGKGQWPLGASWRFFAEAGPYVGYLLKGQEKTSGTSPIYDNYGQGLVAITPPVSFDATTNVRGDLNRFNVGAMAGIGVDYLLSRRDVIYVDIRGEYGLTAVQKDTSQNGRSNTGSAAVLVGFKHTLGGS
jgi:Outer membrane protein beta-barrel domain